MWSPDSERIIFNDGGSLYERSASGEGAEKLLARAGGVLTDWSPNGKYLLLWEIPGDIKVRDMEDITSAPYSFIESKFLESQAYFSPDGKWVAYYSNETGKGEIYVRPFPGPGGKWQVSVNGGSRPHWRGDGKELFFLSDDLKIMSAEMKLGSGNVEIGTIRTLFPIRQISVPLARDIYTVTSDGQKFLVEVFTGNETSPPLTLVTNWAEELKRK